MRRGEERCYERKEGWVRRDETKLRVKRCNVLIFIFYKYDPID